MTGRNDKGAAGGAERDRRLAEALRSNLRRRKAQERSRAGDATAGGGGDRAADGAVSGDPPAKEGPAGA